MICAAIVAGGNGSRMGSDIPKQFLKISDKPILLHTLKCFEKLVDIIVIACHKDYVEYTKDIIKDEINCKTYVIEGGRDRMESVLAVVSHLRSIGGEDDDIVLTHDGVRPFVPRRIIEESIKNVRIGHFCTVAINATDTVCVSSDGNSIDEVLERNKVFNIQTPQTFNLKTLEIMLKSSEKNKYTDMCGLALASGIKVKIVEGTRENIKITLPQDITVAETILKGEKPL